MMSKSSKTVLVTGGAGYIGSHACKALHLQGYVPVCYDNLSTGHKEAVLWGPLITGDVRDKELLTRVLRETEAAAVLHFAASAYVGESMADPQKYYDNNVGGMISLLGAMDAAAVRTLVFSSSCATYGQPSQIPIGEDTPQRPINPYGRTKLICEQMLADFAQANPIDHAILRYFNAAGADPEGDLFEWHDPETHLIPCILLAAMGATSEVRIFGDKYPTPDGTCIRDFIHVSDLADAHVMALERLLNGGGSFIANLGTGAGHSILEVIRACEACSDQPIPQRVVTGRAGDPPVLVADPARAQSLLGFTPKHSSLEKIVATAFSALRKFQPN